MNIPTGGLSMLNEREKKKNARQFSIEWLNRGSEKQETQVFWLSLLRDVLGVSRPEEIIRFEERVQMDNTKFLDGIIDSTHVLIEQKSRDKDLNKPIRQSDGSKLTAFQQAKNYSINIKYSERPRWIVTCNFKEFYIYDMENPNSEPEHILLEDLETEYYRLEFLVDREKIRVKKELEVSIKAGEIIGDLYDALYKQYQEPVSHEDLLSLNKLCVRIVFCLYAEDAGLFGSKKLFHDYLEFGGRHNVRDKLKDLFKILDQKIEDRDPYEDEMLLSFPYVNGGLFRDEEIIIPKITDEIAHIIIDEASDNFNWSSISPTIFGSLFESTLNPETRRSGGMHYTSIENIHKVIEPLFLTELKNEFKDIKELKVERTRTKRLLELQDKISKLTFFDPACGSGNFLTETYLSLRRLENQILKYIYGNARVLISHNPIKVSIDQFYGLEINDFAVTVAKTALWIAESQMMEETMGIVYSNLSFLPLSSNPNIIEGNALKTDWNDIVNKNKLSYIIGNPPFVGARLMSGEQKDDINEIFNGVKGKGNLDYVACWYKKSAEFIDNTNIECALVSTNSITQGEQVAILWKDLLENHNIKINFAYRTFKWTSEASEKAAVYCVIIGFSQFDRKNKIIFTDDSKFKLVTNINPYLVDGPNVVVESTSSPICNVEKMSFGSMPNDDGNLLLSEEEKNEFIKKYPNLSTLIRPLLGAREYINNKSRYCLWIEDNDLHLISKNKFIMERLENVRNARSSSTRKSTKEMALYPYKFGEIRQPDSDYLLIPRVSSENRKYIPIGFIDKNVVSSDANLIIPTSSLYYFGVLTSNVHMAWMRTVAGRLEMRYRYSASVVYNTFPWPNPSEEQRKEIEMRAEWILKARDLYPDSSLADLYNEILMPKELRIAHRNNDEAVMEAYGFDIGMSESDCVSELMKMYQKLIKK